MARPATPPRLSRRRAWCGALVALVAAAMLVAGTARPVAGARPDARRSRRVRSRRSDPSARQEQMLVRAAEINYDYTNERVSAVGNVQIYFGDSTLEADRVIYDQKTKRLHAEGNVR